MAKNIELDTDLLHIGHVSLDLEYALVFKSDNNTWGYIYFTEVYDNYAEYTLRLFKKDASQKIRVIADRNGQASMRGDGSSINFNGFTIIWTSPIHLYLLDNIKYAAVVPLYNLHRINSGDFEQINWIMLEERPSL